MARIVFYATRPQTFIGEITRIFSWTVLNSTQLVMVQTHSFLVDSLANQRENTIVILAAWSAKELDELIVLKELFSSIPIIIILPDNSDETFQSAMTLRPVYFTTIKDDICYLLSFIQEIAYILDERNGTVRYPAWNCRKAEKSKPGIRSTENFPGTDPKIASGRLGQIQRLVNNELRFP